MNFFIALMAAGFGGTCAGALCRFLEASDYATGAIVATVSIALGQGVQTYLEAK